MELANPEATMEAVTTPKEYLSPSSNHFHHIKKGKELENRLGYGKKTDPVRIGLKGTNERRKRI